MNRNFAQRILRSLMRHRPSNLSLAELGRASEVAII
jgi:hypothetical protein